MLAAVALCVLLPQSPSPAPALDLLPAADIHLDGWLGARIQASRTQWLDRVDLAPRIAPFAHRPAEQAWAGEHLGKWLHAASSAWAESGDEVLRTRIASAVDALLAAQGDDGYLGAYLPAQRFQLLPGADWDVWTIKYALLGLLAEHEATGDARALDAARRGADLLLKTFGEGGRSILSAGTHVGMAATSVLEPIARLFRMTGDTRYRDFAFAIVAAWDERGGPRIASSLRETGHVAQVANGKAYEMLSNLVGLCELARATGDRRLMEAPLTAWNDIVARELLPTGSASRHEHFVGGGRLPSSTPNNLGETCVTVTWMQLCAQLLELTGEARFAQEIERSAFNHLAAAQRPDGAAWCYYTALRGPKPYDAGITCCSSSGPRGMALLPQRAVLRAGKDTLVIALPESVHGEAEFGGRRIGFHVERAILESGSIRIRVHFDGALPAAVNVRMRVSEWGVPASLIVSDEDRTVAKAGWVETARREWRSGDTIELLQQCKGRILIDPNDDERAALAFGPFVLALDSALDARLATAAITVDGLPELVDAKALSFRARCVVDGESVVLPLRTFADAGADGGLVRVWLRRGGVDSGPIAVADSRSRAGNVDGSIRDGDLDSFVVTWDGTHAAQDSYAIRFASPQAIGGVRFAHGHGFHDGGWFDCSKGKPVVEVRETEDGEWRVLGALYGYPETTATDAHQLRDGAVFELRLDASVTALELRVRGVPACGDDPRQAFSSCAELRALR
ncbi:MAG: glycoside hydrolase family 127 protein [Planctomycetota bacterium]